MTPKEKAESIIYSFIPYAEVDNRNNWYAKQSALILVNELIDVISEINTKLYDFEGVGINDEVDFWHKVKEEINKL